MELVLEQGYSSLNKFGEELCGDNVASCNNGGYTTLVLADGLGSGVKANILSTLTSKILCTMVSNDIPMEDCIDTIIQSLPVCKIRGVAYSTFSVIHINNLGEGYLFEFDNPRAIYMHNGICQDLEQNYEDILGKKVAVSKLKLSADDVIIIMSDGAIHAGIGMLLNFGWQRDDIIEHLNKVVKKDMSARCIANMLAGACNDLYLNRPGDDTTVAAVRIREKLIVNVMVGPPVDKEKDELYVKRFLDSEGKKVVCGGTTSTIVAKYLGEEINTSFDFPDKEVPPIAKIKGIDITTEGVLTIRKLLTLSEKYLSPNDLSQKYYTKKDGASILSDMLFEKATHINFFVGQSINAAHQGLPIDTTMKLKLVESLSDNLKLMGKIVNVQYD
jgi:phospholipid N-methyltransferase